MARLARVVAPDYPHHIIQRGNRRQDVFFDDADRELYLRLLAENASQHRFSVLAYCLMSNHVHLIIVPQTVDSLAKGIGEAHKRYTAMVNRRNNWTGYLWQGRFQSFVLDENYLHAAIRYVENNPVKAHIVARPHDYTWSSARAHVLGIADTVCDTSHELVRHIDDWAGYLSGDTKSGEYDDLVDKHSRTGRPLGGIEFINRIETLTSRTLRKQKPGPKKG